MTENEIIENNIGLVKTIVNRYKPKNHDEAEEMMQHGMIGVMKAARKHMPELGVLSTIAYNYIRWEILLYLRQKARFNRNIKIRPSKIEYHENLDDMDSFFPEDMDAQTKEIIKLRFSGFNFKEIAEKTNTKISKVKRIYKQAIADLKTNI